MSIAPIIDGHEKHLKKVFQDMIEGNEAEGIERDVEKNSLIPLGDVKSIHFARWAILPASEDVDDNPIGAQLLFSSNYDAPLEDHLRELVEVAGRTEPNGIDTIYQHCQNYPGTTATPPTDQQRIDYLKRYAGKYASFYVGTVGRTVEQIHQEDALRREIQRFLDTQNFQGQQPSAVRQAIRDHLAKNKDFDWAKEPAPPQYTRKVQFIGKNYLWMAILAVLFLLFLLFLPALVGWVSWWVPAGLLLVLLVVAGLLAVVFRIKEKTDPQDPIDYSCPDGRELSASEDIVVQNQMTSILNIKPGGLRLTVERVVQAVINFTARYVSNKGSLAGIPSIHFARWAIVDDGRRLLFLSNFDGSWENYLGDFIDKAASGLTAVWSNCVGFPRTRWLTQEGARDEQRFKSYARRSQVPTQLFYTAYKQLTVQNINNSSQIRAGLYDATQDEKKIQQWLELF